MRRHSSKNTLAHNRPAVRRLRAPGKNHAFCRRVHPSLGALAESAAGDFQPKKIAGWSHHSPPNGGSSVSTTARHAVALARNWLQSVRTPVPAPDATHVPGTPCCKKIARGRRSAGLGQIHNYFQCVTSAPGTPGGAWRDPAAAGRERRADSAASGPVINTCAEKCACRPDDTARHGTIRQH